MPSRRLIINADDFGYTSGVNRAIAECHSAGIVTSSTLMANSAAFDGAVALARSQPSLDVGCHVMLIDGAPLSSQTEVPSLLGPESSAFRTSFLSFARAAVGGKLNESEIAQECGRQLQKLRNAGIELTHFDSHKHTHMFPAVLRPLLRVAREVGIPAVRNPFAPVKAVALAHLARRPKLWVRYSEVKALRTFAERFHRETKAAGLKTTDGTFGIIATGALDQELFEAVMGSIPEGTWEFVCHPGYNDADLQAANTRLKTARQAELKVLTAPESRRFLQQRGIALISYRDL